MGARGPVSKRNEEQLSKDVRRRNDVGRSGTSGRIPPLALPDHARTEWHPLLIQQYYAFASSGESEFFEYSDWTSLQLVLEALAQEMAETKFLGISTKTGEPIYGRGPIPAQTLNAAFRVFAALGATEGDRRRMGIQLNRSAEEEAEEEKNRALAVQAEEDAFGNVVDINRKTS